MNAGSKHFAVTTSLNHCKETITGANDLQATVLLQRLNCA